MNRIWMTRSATCFWSRRLQPRKIFLEILKEFQAQKLGYAGVVQRVSAVFMGHPRRPAAASIFSCPAATNTASNFPRREKSLRSTTRTTTASRCWRRGRRRSRVEAARARAEQRSASTLCGPPRRPWRRTRRRVAAPCGCRTDRRRDRLDLPRRVARRGERNREENALARLRARSQTQRSVARTQRRAALVAVDTPRGLFDGKFRSCREREAAQRARR